MHVCAPYLDIFCDALSFLLSEAFLNHRNLTVVCVSLINRSLGVCFPCPHNHSGRGTMVPYVLFITLRKYVSKISLKIENKWVSYLLIFG